MPLLFSLRWRVMLDGYLLVAGFSYRQHILASNLCAMVFDNQETKFGMVVFHGNVKKLGTGPFSVFTAHFYDF